MMTSRENDPYPTTILAKFRKNPTNLHTGPINSLGAIPGKINPEFLAELALVARSEPSFLWFLDRIFLYFRPGLFLTFYPSRTFSFRLLSSFHAFHGLVRMISPHSFL